ncbi:hemin uptake protein HemP [Anianabacter salinae]|uniref:hemin uptake protein HemP n=1 Tax=Anianabacter salinae TaxID=2851023 RepID=UPI00225DF03E|nr:hemin uptake protein HemP [Anianabacter salinae]MBV0912474.1 hemin uptake protein HemP [Anianabacter salinae]
MANDPDSFGRGQPARTDDGQTPPSYDARDLVGPGAQARIILDGKTYTLRITRTDKLILTK